MQRITDQERIAACKVLGVCSAVTGSGKLVICHGYVPITQHTRTWGWQWQLKADSTVRTETIVADCPDWRKSARDENGEVVE